MVDAPATPRVRTFFHDATFTAQHVVWCPVTKAAAIIDPALDFEAKAARTDTESAEDIAAFVDAEGLEVAWILETHVHADHLTAAPWLKERFDAPVAIGASVKAVQETFGRIFGFGGDFSRDGSQFDRLFEDGDTFRLGEIAGRVIHTPGHTPACVTYVIGDAAFCGDSLFMPDFGSARTDFPGGDATTLYRSIQRILELPPETRLFVGHDYKTKGRDEFAWETTIADERAHNVHVGGGVSEADFVALREGRDSGLAPPALMLAAVQVNINGGRPPPPQDDGVSYLKLPLNVL